MPPFRLARVLQLRGQLRSLRRLEAQRIEDERSLLLTERERLDDARREALDDAALAVDRGPVDGAMLGLARAYEEVLRARLDRVAERLDENQALLMAKREQLGRERREERKLEHLETRHRTQAEIEAALAAEHLLDELVLARHGRERGEGSK